MPCSRASADGPVRLVEHDLYESVNARTESLQILRELGPPDLVHLVKSQPKTGLKEVYQSFCEAPTPVN